MVTLTFVGSHPLSVITGPAAGLLAQPVARYESEEGEVTEVEATQVDVEEELVETMIASGLWAAPEGWSPPVLPDDVPPETPAATDEAPAKGKGRASAQPTTGEPPTDAPPTDAPAEPPPDPATPEAPAEATPGEVGPQP